MTAQTAEIARAAKKLPAEEKIALAEALMADALAETSPEHEALWQAEIQRRREEVRSGKVKLIPGDEVAASLDRLLR